jgi:hypothetical protein
MLRCCWGDADVLVCTSIIESSSSGSEAPRYAYARGFAASRVGRGVTAAESARSANRSPEVCRYGQAVGAAAQIAPQM